VKIGFCHPKRHRACELVGVAALAFSTVLTTGCGGRLMGGRILDETPTLPTLAALQPSLNSLQVQEHRPGYIIPLAIQHKRDDLYCVTIGYTREHDKEWQPITHVFSHSVTLSSHFSRRGEGVYAKCVNGRSATTLPMTNEYAAERLAFFEDWEPVYTGVNVEIRDRDGHAMVYHVWGAYFRFEFPEPCERVLVRLATQNMGTVEYWGKWTEVALVAADSCAR